MMFVGIWLTLDAVPVGAIAQAPKGKGNTKAKALKNVSPRQKSIKKPSITKKRSVGKSRKRGRKQSYGRPNTINTVTMVNEFTLDSGILYRTYRTNGKRPIIAHVLECDRSVAGNAVRLVKGEDHATGLERIKDMSARLSDKPNHVLYGLVNGNFWRAVSNLMIGPCVIDGEVVQMSSYKKWSSAFFDVRSGVSIDTFRMSGMISIGSRRFPIESVNDRQGNGVVVYNMFGGNVVPFLSTRQIEKAFNEAVRDSSADVDDSTEYELTQDMLKAEIAAQQRERDAEFPMVKIRVRYLRTPSINTTISCEVLGVDTGAVNMPLRGAVISVPKALIGSVWPRIRDTVKIRYETNLLQDVRFMNAVSGTPRLVRDGIAKNEAVLEGSTGRRFIHHTLARTGVGASKDGSKIFLVAVPPDRPEEGTQGATLQQMAEVMALIGCYQALNLDGGGSAGMTIKNDHVFYDGVDPLTRKLGLGIGIVKLAKILRTTGY